MYELSWSPDHGRFKFFSESSGGFSISFTSHGSQNSCESATVPHFALKVAVTLPLTFCISANSQY